jgi:hypothetical protein
MLARNKFLHSFSRPALRAAACGGRPRAGSDAAARATGLTAQIRLDDSLHARTACTPVQPCTTERRRGELRDS